MFFLLLLALIFLPEPARAYIDPGTGGMVASFFSTIVIVAVSIGSFILAFVLKPLWRFLKKYKYFSLGAIVLLLGVAFYAWPFSKDKPKNTSLNMEITNSDYKKFIVLGIDGFDPSLAEYLMDKNELPNFKRLKEAGSYSQLKTTNPPISPVVWTSVATGKNPGETNLFDFIRFDRDKMLPFLSITDESKTITGIKYAPPIKSKTVWNTSSENGLFTSVIHWPITFPADEINGELLAGMGVPDVRGFMNGYSRYTNKADAHANKFGTDRVVNVSLDGSQVSAEVEGPLKTTGNSYTSEPFTVSIKDENNAVLIIQDKEYPLQKKVWSGWVEVKFKQGFGKSTQGMFKVYVENLKPDFDLFITSIQFDPANPAANISYPTEFSKELNDEIGKYYTLGMPEETKAVNDLNLSVDALVAQADEIRQEREKMFWREFDILKNKNAGLMMIVFDEFDRLNHILYGNEVKKVDGKITEMGQNITKIYQNKDVLLGQILDKLSANTGLIVLSDHGFNYFSKTVNLNNWLYDNGYIVLKNNITADKAGVLYKDVDWSKTRAYSFGYVSINLNLKNREKYGIVPTEEKNNLLREIAEKLKRLEYEGANVVENVYDKNELYSGPYLDNIGDIIVGFRPPFRTDWENPVGGFNEKTITNNPRPWNADHIFDPKYSSGVLFTNLKISKLNPSVFDITPTVLDALGIKTTERFDGSSLIAN